MIDSVLNGTGNSRFLKSAVPAGTSWADALAMLQAGTFPIDFNGINTEGFQQVGTPLNKANLLKDATAAQIGLPPSTTPDGMFQALGNTGELHVWRKMVKTSSDTPAGYTLGDTLTHGNSFIVRQTTGTGYVDAVIQETSSISVNDNGVISASWGSTISLRYGNSVTFTPGRFVKISSINTKALSSFAVDDVVWVPSDGGIQMNFSNDYGYYIEFTKCQKVNAHGIIPAGTTTTYPVSINPNAYQEGDDAKAAGYVVGAATSMKIISYAGGSGYYVRFYTADSVSVSDSGALSIVEDNNSAPLISKSSDGSELRGKYIKYHSSYQASTEIVSGMIYFVPSNAVFTWSNGMLICDKVQLVTGYPAIPAGTTIEYLGKLGDKARVQVVSYVGTGTYGESNPNSLTFNFAPKIVKFLFQVEVDIGNHSKIENFQQDGEQYYMVSDRLTTEFVQGEGFGYNSYAVRGKKSADGKTFTWYTNINSQTQGNQKGMKYYFIAIG